MKAKNVLLVGTYCALNKGDQLMQTVMIEQLSKLPLPPKIKLASPFIDIDKNFYKDISIVKSRRRNLPFSLFNILLLILLPERLVIKYCAHISELKAYYEADIIIDLSGDMLTEDYGIIVGISHSIPLILAKVLKKKYLITAQSIGKFRFLKPLYINLLNSAELVLCREDITLNYLKDLKIKNLKRVDDLGFLLKPSKSTFSVSNSPYFCFSPSGLLLKKFCANLSTQEQIKSMASLLDKISEDYNILPVLVPHVMTPAGKLDDDKVCLLIANEMKSTPVILDKKLLPDEIKKIISHSKLMIALRMHAAIAALSESVPVIAVAYSHKMHGVMASCNQKEFIIDYDDNSNEQIFYKVKHIMENHDLIVDKLTTSLVKVNARAKKSIALIEEKLNA
ncbi:MAG: polysaccharide pyruvyl transferase family protein [Colwellia sp.]|nr:polysaccharide pyruvyl transferase family protein [Colwellia sp.]